MKRESEPLELDVARPTEIVREVARLARVVFGDNAEVIWFGSWPQGRALPRSDIDLALATGAPIPPERMALFEEAVDKLPTLYKIDIIDLNGVGPALRQEILKHGVHL